MQRAELVWRYHDNPPIEDASGLLDLNVFGDARSLVVGVSGGSDSMALLHLLHRAGFDCLAVTVDHRLRNNSTAEAGVRTRCLPLAGRPPPDMALGRRAGRPSARQQEQGTHATRCWRGSSAGYGGGPPIVVGHTLDDQVETIRMRAWRGGGTLGLSGIAPVSFLPSGRRLVRPLLAARRSMLRDWFEGARAALDRRSVQ